MSGEHKVLVHARLIWRFGKWHLHDTQVDSSGKTVSQCSCICSDLIDSEVWYHIRCKHSGIKSSGCGDTTVSSNEPSLNETSTSPASGQTLSSARPRSSGPHSLPAPQNLVLVSAPVHIGT